MDSKFPEAGAVAFTSWKRPDGFVVNFTVRDTDGSQAYTRIDLAIKKAMADKCVPYEKSFTKAKAPVDYVEGRVCPIDGGKLIKPSADNRPIKCENGKYDFATKTKSGCAYVEWPQPKQDIPERQVDEEY